MEDPAQAAKTEPGPVPGAGPGRDPGRYRTLTEELPAITYIVELQPAPRTIYISPQVFPLLGFTQEEWIAEPDFWIRRLHPEDRGEVLSETLRCNRSGESFAMEYRILARDARVVWVRNTAACQRDPSGRPLAVHGVMLDVTERKRSEARLQIAQQSYREVLDSLTESIYIQDGTGSFIEVNRGAERMYRCRREDLIGKTPRDVAAPGRNDLEEIARRSEEVARTGRSAQFRFWAVRSDGEVFPKEVVVNRGRYFGRSVLIAVARDISGQIRAEEEREALHAELAQARRLESIGRLAGGVAHDFNNMLQVILGNADMVLESLPDGTESRRGVEEIQRADERSAHLARQLLAFARKQAVRPRRIQLNEAVSGILGMLHRLLGEGVRIEWRPGASLPPLRMDPSQVDQILVNLCVNGRDAMDGTGVLVIETAAVRLGEEECAPHEGVAPGDHVVLSVRDSGAGMDEETRERLYEPFFTTKEVGQGTGLGLSTVYGIVRQNRGFIQVESAPGEGAVFRIYLPRHPEPDGEPEGPDRPAPAGGGGETLLLVEDDPAVLSLTRSMLERLGYNVLATGDPFEAIRLALARDPLRMLVTDMVMPRMKGGELARRIRAVRPEIRCLFISGHAAETLSPAGPPVPGAAFLQKPFSLSDLAGRVREGLGARAPGPPPPGGTA